MSDSQNFLTSFLDKIGNEIEYGTKTLANDPGKALVGTVDTLLAQNNPLNPTAYLNNAIRRGLGSSFLNKEGLGVLNRERDDEGKIKTNLTDAFLLQDQDDVEKVGEKAINSSAAYAPLRNEGMGARKGPDGKGALYTATELEAASQLLDNERVQTALTKGATFDPTKTVSSLEREGEIESRTKTLVAQGVLNPDGTVKRSGSGDPTSLEGLEVLKSNFDESENNRKRDEAHKTKMVQQYGPDALNPDGSLKSESALQLKAAAQDPSYLLNVAQVKQRDAEAQRDAEIELASLGLKKALGEGELDLSKLKLKAEVDIANQQTAWLNDKDLRDHEYKMRQQEMNQFDDIMKIIMAGGNFF